MVGRSYPKQNTPAARAKREAESAAARASYAQSQKAADARAAYTKRYGGSASSVYKDSSGRTVTITTTPSGETSTSVSNGPSPAPKPVQKAPEVQRLQTINAAEQNRLKNQLAQNIIKAGSKRTDQYDPKTGLTRSTLEVSGSAMRKAQMVQALNPQYVQFKETPAPTTTQRKGSGAVWGAATVPKGNHVTSVEEYKLRQKDTPLLEKADIKLSQYGKTKTKFQDAPVSFAVGVGRFGVGLASFGKNLVTHPIKTVKGVGSGLKNLAKDPYAAGYQLGRYIEDRPFEFAGQVAGYYGASKLINLGTKKSVQSVRSRNLKVELEGVTTQKGKVINIGDKQQATSVGKIKGSAKTYYEIGGKKFLTKQYKEVLGQAKYSGTKSDFDVVYQAQIKGPKGKLSTYQGAGTGRVSDLKGAELYEMIGKTKGSKTMTYSKGLRGYEIKLGKTKPPEGLSIFVKKGEQTTLVQQQPYWIQAVSKETASKAFKSAKSLKREVVLAPFRTQLRYEYGKAGKFMTSSDVGVVQSMRQSPIIVKSKGITTVGGQEFPYTIKQSYPGTSLEKFQKVGLGYSETIPGVQKASAARANDILAQFIPKEYAVNPSQYLGVGVLAPPTKILVEPALKPSFSYLYQSGEAAQSFTRGAVRSAAISQPSKIASIAGFSGVSSYGASKIKSPGKPTFDVFRSRSKIEPIIRERTTPQTRPILDAIIKPISKPALKPSLRPALKASIKSALQPLLKPALQPALKPALQPALKPALKPVVKPALKPSIFPQFPLMKEPIFPLWGSGQKSSPRSVTGFNVFVKSRGKWLKVSDKPLPKMSALSFGSRAVERTTAATFSLRRAGQVKAQKKQDIFFSLARERLRSKKGGSPLTFVEKNKYRINTAGELSGITVKGWLAKRRKAKMMSSGLGSGRSMKNLFGW